MTNRTSMSLSDEVVGYLSDITDNRSAYVNKLIEQDMNRGGHDYVERVRIDRLRDEVDEINLEIETLEEKRQQKIDRIDELEKAVEAKEKQKMSHRSDVLDDAFDVIADVPLDPENKAVVHWAQKADMTPEELIECYREENDE